jgi:outer membrane protein assembly factor BamB
MGEPLATPSKPARQRFFPNWIVLAIVAFFVIALVAVRATDPAGDEAVINVLTLVLGFLAAATLMLWFAFFSSYSRVLRLVTFASLALGIGIFFTFYKIERVTGALIPTFRPRFSQADDAQLGALETSNDDGVDLSATSADDFPGFLGPNRDAVLTSVSLERDWEKHPPKLLWKQSIGAGWSGFAVVNGYAITLEQRGDQELIACYEVLTGKPRWQHTEPGRHETVLGGIGPRSTPTIHNGKVFVTTAGGILACLEGATGKPLWRVNLIEKFGSTKDVDAAEISWGRATSPLIVDDLVVVPAGGPPGKAVSLAAFKQDSGELAWQSGSTQISYASPTLATLAGVPQILSVNESNVSGHDRETGKLLWEADWAGDSSANASASQPQTPGNDRVLLSKGYSVGARMLKVEKGADGAFTTSTLWESSRVLKTKFTNAAIINNHAYDLSDGLLECVDLETGERTWRGQRYGHGQVLAVGDVLLVMTENTGEVVMVDASPEKFTELGRLQALEGQTWNNLCLAGKHLLVRNSQEAACFELPLRTK